VRLVFWLSMGGLLYTYAGYPALAWLLARLWPQRWTAAPIAPSVSIVLAVHNGAGRLKGQIERLLALDYPNIKEIIAVSDGSTDGTAEWLTGQRHPRLTTIILEEHGGKAVALNAGMSRATAEIILFVDIRPEIAPGAVRQLVSNFADPKVGCVTGELILRQGSHDAASAAVGGVYWRYEKWIRALESIFSSPVGVYGGFYAIRRSCAVPQPAGIILDDMFQPLAIIRQGYRSVLDPRACVYDIWPARIEEEFHRKVRTLVGNFQLFQLAPWTLSLRNPVFFQLVSHKLMRLVAPYLLILLLASSLALARGSYFYAAFAILQIFGWTVAVAALRYKIPLLQRVAAVASALLVLDAAAVAGLYKFLFTRGPLWKIWTSCPPVASAITAETKNPRRQNPFAVPAEKDRV
jgi:cellulose synthase/poly-beta-1,6-N-acetylglucosamine synthase-like glycosyltransferase